MNLHAQAAALGITGMLHPNEVEYLHELARGRDVLEVGSFRGLSAWTMAQTARSLWCVDTFKANSAGQQQMPEVQTLDAFLAATRGFGNVRHFVGTSEEAAAHLVGTFGLVFLDAMHTYEDVKADIRRWRPRLRRGGLLVIHDYGHGHFPGVQRAVDEVLGPPKDRPTMPDPVTLAWWRKP